MVESITPEQLKKVMRDRFDVKIKNKQITFEMLDHPIVNLRPITLLEDKPKPF